MNDLPTDALTSAAADFKAQGFRVDAVPGNLSVSANAREVALKALDLLDGRDYLINNPGASGHSHPHVTIRSRRIDG